MVVFYIIYTIWEFYFSAQQHILRLKSTQPPLPSPFLLRPFQNNPFSKFSSITAMLKDKEALDAWQTNGEKLDLVEAGRQYRQLQKQLKVDLQAFFDERQLEFPPDDN